LSRHVAERLEGLPPSRPEQADVSPLLDDVAAAAERYARAQEERRQALEDLRAKVRIARDEGISFAAIARAARVSREYVRRLYAAR
jgi:cell division septum initiation protein DivIVA